MKLKLAVGLLTWLVIAKAHAATHQESFVRDIVLPEQNSEEVLAAAPLDAEVCAQAQPNFTDVRVLDSKGNEVAFVLRKATETRTETVRQRWTAPDPTVNLREDGSLELTFELKKDDPLPTGFRLATPLADFERRVSAASSADGNEWTPRLENGLIFDYSQMIDVQNDSLALNTDAAAHRHFRIVVEDVTQEQQSQLVELTRRLQGTRETERSERSAILRRPFRIDRVELWRDNVVERATGPRLVSFPVTFGSATEDQASRSTQWLITSNNAPITKLRVQTKDRNFSRAARVEIESRQGVETSWRSIATSTLAHIDFRDTQREELSIELPETRVETMRLVIENRDSAPLALTGIEAFGSAYEAIFLAAPAEKYRLAYRTQRTERPDYDVAAIDAALAANYAPQLATLGPASGVEMLVTEAPWLTSAIKNPVILTAAIGVLAALLGVGLYRASQRVDKLPRE